MDAKQPKATRQQRSEKTLQSILRACDKLLARKSFEQISMQEIARTAGVSVGNVYNRFEDKEALVDYVLLTHQQAVLSQVDHELSQLPSDIALRQKFHATANVIADAIASRGPIFGSLAARHARGMNVSSAAQGNSDLLVDKVTAWLMANEAKADEQRCRFAVATITFSLQFDVIFGTAKRLFGDTLTQQLGDQAYQYVIA